MENLKIWLAFVSIDCGLPTVLQTLTTDEIIDDEDLLKEGQWKSDVSIKTLFLDKFCVITFLSNATT